MVPAVVTEAEVESSKPITYEPIVELIESVSVSLTEIIFEREVLLPRETFA
jgi:hypothetical protein